MQKIKLALSIRSLNIGGAERQFLELVKGIDKSKYDVTVFTMYGGVRENEIINLPDIKYINLNKKNKFDLFNFSSNYLKALKKLKPDIIYSFMGEMNLFSYFCKPTSTKLIWGFRSSYVDYDHYGLSSKVIFFLQKIFSKKIDKIICNSSEAISYFTKEGFYMKKSEVIYNGIDTKYFQKDVKLRDKFRTLYGLEDDDIAVGIIARIDHMKDYPTFCKSANHILNKFSNVKFFSVGGGDESIKAECQSILADNENFIWLDSQSNMRYIYSGLDVSVSTSRGEGFSNSIAEAMASKLICIVTNVGDSAYIVNNRFIFDVGNIEQLNNHLEFLIKDIPSSIGIENRQRIENMFSVENMINATEKVIKSV